MIRNANVIGLLLLVIGLICQFGCAAEDVDEPKVLVSAAEKSGGLELKEFSYSQIQMAMPMQLTVWCESEVVAQTSCKLAFKRAAELVKVFSDYDPESEINQLLAGKVGEPCPVSRELFEVLAFSKRLFEESNGAFDPTSGAVVKLWRQARKSGELPARGLLESAKTKTGFENLLLDSENQTVTLLAGGVQLDFGGVAKGYIGDQVIELLRGQNASIAKYRAGGDVVVGDPPPNSTGWGIQVFDRDGKPKEMSLSNCGVSTSGDLSQFVEIDGVRYSHVVDPRTGQGVGTRRLTVVIAESGLQSDAIATAGGVLDEREFQCLIEKYDSASGWSTIEAK